MLQAWLSDADPTEVSHAVREVLQERGALVREHVTARVRFFQRPAGRLSWGRAGYVGIYQHLGERETRLRLRLRAKWPYRIFWGTAAVVLAACIGTVLFSSSGTVWFLVAFFGALALLATGLVHMNTWAAVRVEERDLFDAFGARLAALEGVVLLTQEERDARAFDLDLEGEIEQAKMDQDRRVAREEQKASGEKKPRFALRRRP